MKKQLLAVTATLSLPVAAVAQGLYDLAPTDEVQESSPINWTAGISLNYDDNVTPTISSGAAGYEDDVTSINAYVGASLVSLTPQTTWDLFARVGANSYLDSPSASGTDSFNYQARLGVNWAHRVSERLRLSSRNYIAYELEPDYSYGFATDRQIEEYLHYQTENAVGYRWTERLATYSGFRVRGLLYGSDESDNDRTIYSLFHQFRYRSSEQTVWTLEYDYSDVASSGTAGDSGNHIITVGVEHRFSPNSVIALKTGTQIRDVDGGSNATTPYLDCAIRTTVNEQFSVRAFARYSIEDYGTSFDTATFDSNYTLRVGVTASYIVSPRLTLSAGVNMLYTRMEDGRVVDSGPANGSSIPDADTDLLNLYIGCSLQLSDNVYATASYNWTDSDSDIAGRNYQRNHASLGIAMTF